MYDDKEHPFWVLVGNSESVAWADAAVAYVTFYHQFFKGTNIDECVRLMCAASGDQNFMRMHGKEIKSNWQTYSANNFAQGLAAALANN